MPLPQQVLIQSSAHGAVLLRLLPSQLPSIVAIISQHKHCAIMNGFAQALLAGYGALHAS